MKVLTKLSKIPAPVLPEPWPLHAGLFYWLAAPLLMFYPKTQHAPVQQTDS